MVRSIDYHKTDEIDEFASPSRLRSYRERTNWAACNFYNDCEGKDEIL